MNPRPLSEQAVAELHHSLQTNMVVNSAIPRPFVKHGLCVVRGLRRHHDHSAAFFSGIHEKDNDLSLQITMLTNSTSIKQFEVEVLFKLLTKNHGITMLSGFSYVDDSGAKNIADYLVENLSLRVLDLDYSYLSERGCMIIVESLIYNDHLEYLSLKSPYLSNAVLQRLLTILRENNVTLKKIEFSCGRSTAQGELSPELINAIKQQLEENAKLVAESETRNAQIASYYQDLTRRLVQQATQRLQNPAPATDALVEEFLASEEATQEKLNVEKIKEDKPFTSSLSPFNLARHSFLANPVVTTQATAEAARETHHAVTRIQQGWIRSCL